MPSPADSGKHSIIRKPHLCSTLTRSGGARHPADPARGNRRPGTEAVHVVFAGAGQCAEYIARRIIREGHDVTLIEADEARADELDGHLDAHILRGDATRLSTWQQFDASQAGMIMACTHDDASNVAVCLIANDRAPEAFKALRLRTPEYAEWQRMLQTLGVRVDRVVHPEVDIGNRILRVLSVPGVADIRDFADGAIKVFSMNVRTDVWLAGHTLQTIHADPRMAQCRLCMVFRNAASFIPDDDERVMVGDHVYLVTPAAQLDDSLRGLSVGRSERLRQVFIVGGNEVGLELARALEQRHVAVKLFDRDAQRCDHLANELQRTVVIHADGTNQEVLLGENIEGVDAFVALTSDDDANLISCLLARRLGVRKVVPLLNRINYIPLAQRLGINTTVSPRIKAADALLEHIRRGGVQSVRTLGEEDAEAIELVVPEGCAYAGKRLRQLDLPRGTLVGAMARTDGEAWIPQPEDIVMAGDRIVFFAKEEAVRRLEQHVLIGRTSRWRPGF